MRTRAPLRSAYALDMSVVRGFGTRTVAVAALWLSANSASAAAPATSSAARYTPTRAVVAAAQVDPDLVERNAALSRRSQRGDRFMIGGRITAIAGGLSLATGITMLILDRVADPDGEGLLVGGAVLTGFGVAASLTGGGLALYGKREIDAARRGELRADQGASRPVARTAHGSVTMPR